MSARIRTIKSNILSNKNTKIFAKTVTSNFMKSSEKSAKTNKEFVVTKSTRFSDNPDTTIIASSIRTISKFRTRKKAKPIFINLGDFHKQFLLNKNKDNDIISGLYTQNGCYNTIYSTIKSKYIPISSPKNNKIKLTKKSASPSFYSNYSGIKSRNLLFHNNKFNKNNNLSNSIFGSFFENKSNKLLKEISKISKLKKSYNITNTNSNNYSNENNIYSNLFSSKIFKEYEPIPKKKKSLKKETNNLLNTNSELFKKGNNNSSSQKSINDNKPKKIGELFYYMGRNKITLIDKLAYPSFNSYLFARAKRFENIEQFIYKTKLLSLDKYIKKINNNTYIKQLATNENILEKQALNQRSLEIMKKLFLSYRKTMDEYLRFLSRKFREMKEENEKYIQRMMKIDNDNEKIRQKIIRGITEIKEGYAVKYFLMCVKNHTLSIEKFDEEDIKIIENDKLKLNENYYLKYPKSRKKNRKGSRILSKLSFSNKLKKNSDSEKSDSFKKVNSSSEDHHEKFKSNKAFIKLFNERNSEYRIFDSIEEFFAKFDSIVTKIYILIKESSDKAVNNVYLKVQLENLIKNTENERKDKIVLDNQIKLYEQNLKVLKIKNKQLSDKLNGLMDNKFKEDVKIILVLKNILNIYNNIRKKYDIQIIKKDDVIVFGHQIYLKIIESFFFKMLDKVKQDKINYPQDYEILKLRMEKRKKINAFIQFQKLLAQKIQIKIDAVLKRASKVIYKRNRKTNDYREYYRNSNSMKELENSKSTIELFFEYLNGAD